MSRGGTGWQVYFAPSTDAALKTFYTKAGRAAVNSWTKKFLRSQIPKATEFARKNAVIRERSGKLRKAISAKMTSFRGIPSLSIGVFSGRPAEYAGTVNFGTQALNPASPIKTIVPRVASCLAFAPAGSPANNADGSPRYRSPRNYPAALQIIKFRNGGRTIGAMYRKVDLKMASREGLGLRAIQAVYLLITEMDYSPTFFLDNVVDLYLPVLYKDLQDALTIYLDPFSEAE